VSHNDQTAYKNLHQRLISTKGFFKSSMESVDGERHVGIQGIMKQLITLGVHFLILKDHHGYSSIKFN
jgi:hypothetical protein